MTLRRIALILLLIFLPLEALPAQQYSSGPFIFNVQSAGESFFEYNQYIKVTGDLGAQERQQILRAANYWTERVGQWLSPAIIITVAKVDNPNGSAYSYTPPTSRSNPDLYNYIVDGAYYPPDPMHGYHSLVVFETEYYPVPTRLLMDDSSMTSVMAHELMHALGMGGFLRDLNDVPSWNKTSWVTYFPGTEAWASRLYDIKGNRARDDMLVFNAADPANRSNGEFVLPQFNADPMAFAPGQISFFPTFHGPQVDALTGGTGMPVMAGNGVSYFIDGGNVLGHPALLGSIMSYSPVRNMLFTELELAALSDMGYTIDLKKFFGKSYYPTKLGGMLTQDGAFAAGEAGYLAETPLTVTNTNGFDSDASYGTGLHVYRDWLNVTQAADLTASGYGAGGIRVDGTNNTVTIPSGVNIRADGPYGTGILVSYGKNNVINLQGNVEATGEMGIGAHFGIGTAWSYYYMPNPDLLVNSDDRYFYTKMNSDLNGPLVSAFNVSGSLRGTLAAIKIDRDAHVGAINVRTSASLSGDIVSEWNPAAYGLSGSRYRTDLNFGGSSTPGDTDSNFSMRYSGNITGAYGLNMYVRGGTLSYNGTASVFTAQVDPGATLMGNATINPTSARTPFVNYGTIAPGNSIGVFNIGGNFLNAGNLLMEFNASGGYDKLNVTGSFTNNGTVTVTPTRDYYQGTTTIPFQSMFSASGGTPPTSIDSFVSASSPTLSMSMSGGPVYTMTTIRGPNAYSRYGASSNAVRAGRALDAMGDIAFSDTQTLFAALDFSPPGGSGVASALGQLSPQAYNSAAQASADAERMLSACMLLGMLDRAGGAPQEGGRAVFAQMYGGIQDQQAGGGAIGYSASDSGMLAGFEQRLGDDGLTAGLHAALGYRQASMRLGPGAQAAAEHLDIGAHALIKPEQWRGAYLYGMGRLGIENNRMTRNVGFEDYRRTSRADWIGGVAAASAGGGYEHRFGPVAVGPLAGLDFTCLVRPQITEYDGAATRLTLDGAAFSTLRSGLGVQARLETALSERVRFKAGGGAQWMHDLLDQTDTVRAAFVGYEPYKFDAKRTGPTDSLFIQGNASLEFNSNFKLSLYAGSELFRTGYSSLHGGLSAGWSF